MGCSHAESCPQFPLLNASLRGWRDYYCDHEDRWRECARYRMALTGRIVPINLLPNGKYAQYLANSPDADRSGAAEPDGPREASDAGRHEAAEPARPMPYRPMPAPDAGLSTAPITVVSARPAPAHAQVTVPGPRRSHEPMPAQRVRLELQPGRRASRPRRGWWARLVDWMRGPA